MVIFCNKAQPGDPSPGQDHPARTRSPGGIAAGPRGQAGGHRGTAAAAWRWPRLPLGRGIGRGWRGGQGIVRNSTGSCSWGGTALDTAQAAGDPCGEGPGGHQSVPAQELFPLIAQRYSRTVRTQPTRCGMTPLEHGAGTRHPFMVPSPEPSRDSGNDPAAKARSVSNPARAALPGDFKSRPAQTRRPGLTFSVQSLMQVL